jgi:hypothetical protein
MSNTAPIYTSSCRFTDAFVQVAHHGHGVRISLGNADEGISRFLDEAQANDLARNLVRAGFGPAGNAPRIEGRVDRLETAVFTGRMETHMAIMQERIGRLENARAALTETLRVV